jgi:serine/threonine protein kinase
LERFLGKGQYGQVWQSSSPGQTSVALKFLNLDGKEGWREFRSIQQVKGIRHAHLMPITALWLLDEQGAVLNDDVLSSIAPTHEQGATETLTAAPRTGSAKPTWLVVAQLLGDQTLADRLKEHQAAGSDGIPPDELLRYMEEAAKGIDFLNAAKHDLGEGKKVSLQHCDIKPANVLLIGGSVLICDFGVVRTLGEKGISTTATSMVGSPAYMAPELIERRPSPWSDQYALAITYYELRTGHLPFRNLEYMEVMDAHRKGQLDFSRVPAAEQKVLSRATAVKPQDRYPTSAEMVADLRRVFQAEPAVRKPFPLAKAGIAALAAMVAVVLAMVWRPGPSPAPKLAEIQVIPRDAEVQIDDVFQTVGPDGTVQLELPTRDIRVTVRKPPEFEDAVQTITVRELSRQQRLTIQLRGNVAHFAGLAQQQLRDGNLGEAIASYSRAMQIDNSRAQFPAATVLQRPEQAVGKIRCLAVTADGKWLVAGTEGKFVRVWDLESPDLSSVQDLQSHQQPVAGVAVTHDAIVSSDLQGVVEIHPLDKNASGPRATLTLNPGILTMEASPDGRWLITASPGPQTGSMVQSWDLNAADIPASGRQLMEHELTVSALAISSDNQWLFSGSWDGTARCQSLDALSSPSSEIARFTDSDGEIYCLKTVQGRALLGGRLTFEGTTSQNCLVSAGRGSNDVRPFSSGHDATIESMAVAKSGRLVASGGEDGSVQVWKLDASGLPDQAVPLPSSAHRSRVGGLAFDPTEQWLLSVGDDGRVLMWDLAGSGRREPVVVGLHTGTITGLVLLPSGRAVTAGEDGTVRLWDLPFCQLIKRACDKVQIEPTPASAAPSGMET